MRTTARHLVGSLLLILAAALPAAAMEVIEDHQDLTGPFETGPDVTAACLECHDDVAHDFMKTSHWTWEPMQNIIGKGKVALGKKNTINNFCVAIDENWPRCTSCHAGYGWKDASFDFSDPTKIDCLVCHDRTGKYRKFPTGAGHPVYEAKAWNGKIWEPVDLAGIARAVGEPRRENCGACHFSGGGGNNVKHGDMEKALAEPAFALDVHMSPEGMDFTCQDCHTTEDHEIAGNAMFVSPSGYNHLECTACHDEDLHAKKILNWHGKSVACQTCHIPAIARANPTKTWWDWSTAGEDRENVKDEFGMDTWVKKKGTFEWARNVRPAYAWYAGKSGQYLIGDPIDPEITTRLNWPEGDRADPKAKIYPFKIMRGKQPYDAGRNVIAVPKLFGKGGYWKSYDWADAVAKGMASVGQEFSGEVGFVATESWWKVNHMVAPAEQALKCAHCHGDDGRMNWQALGYESDPERKQGISRFELSKAYE